MAFLAASARLGAKAGKLSKTSKSLEGLDKVRSTSYSSRESLSLKSVSKKFDPLKAMHGNQLKPDIKAVGSFKSRLDGSLNVTKLEFGSRKSQEMGNFLRNEGKFSQDAHQKVEKFIKEGEIQLEKIDKHTVKEKLVKDAHELIKHKPEIRESVQDGKSLLEEAENSKDKDKLLRDTYTLVEDTYEDIKELIVKEKDYSAKSEHPDNTKSRSDNVRLARAFEKARANLELYSREYSSKEEIFQARNTKVGNYPFYDVSRQKVVHENNDKHLNVEKSTLKHNQELKDKLAKGWDRLHSINDHVDNFNQQLRQFDFGVVERLLEAYGVHSLSPEYGNQQQNTNGTSGLGNKLKEKMGLSGNKQNQWKEHKAGVKGGIGEVSRLAAEHKADVKGDIGEVSHLAAEHKTGVKDDIGGMSHLSTEYKTGGKGDIVGEVSHLAAEHKAGMNLARSEIKETGIPRILEKAEIDGNFRKRIEVDDKKIMQDQDKEQQKIMRELLAMQEPLIIEHHKPDISEINRNMGKDNIAGEEYVNNLLQDNDIKEENQIEKKELRDKKNKKEKKEEQPQEYGEVNVEGNNDKVEKYSKERNQQILEGSLLSQKFVNRDAKVASGLENSVPEISDAIADVPGTAPNMPQVPKVAVANVSSNVHYASGDNLQRPLKSLEGPSQSPASVEQLKKEYIGLIEGKAENESQKFRAIKLAESAYEAFVKTGWDPKKLVEAMKEAAKSPDFAAELTSLLRQKEETGFRDTHQVQQETSMAREIRVES